MSAPLVPSPLDCIGRRHFAFYPPIKNIEPNEWLLGSGSWTEVQVLNAKTGGEMWIPRQYIGAVADNIECVLTVGLRKELEYKEGTLEPRVKRVIEMPHASEDTRPKLFIEAGQRPSGPAPVVGIKTENRENSATNKALVALGIAALLSFLAFALSVVTRS